MEHRKRSMMQHKVELSTLLKLVIAKPKTMQQQKDNIAGLLAGKAIHSLRTPEVLYSKTTNRKRLAEVY